MTSEDKQALISYRIEKSAAVFVEAEDNAKLVSRLQNMRQSGDYDDMFDWTEEDVRPLIEPTRTLLEKMKGLLSHQ